MPESTAMPLADLTVLDFTAFMAGPYCTRMLADLGARVIKVEPPSGDPIRQQYPVREGHSAFFGHLNAGKESIVLDLKSDFGRAAARRLCESADVLVQNYKPGAMERLGLGYEQLKERCPHLVYCSISGYGQSGPRSDLPAYAPTITADSGFDLANLAYQEDQTRPASTGLYVADYVGATIAFGAVTTGLYRALATGEGSHVDVSLFNGVMPLLVGEVQTAQFGREGPPSVFRPSRTSDGFVVVAPISNANFIAVVKAIGRADLVEDPRFDTVNARRHHAAELDEFIEAWTSVRTSEVVVDWLRANEVPCARYRTAADVLADADAAASGTFQEVEDPAGRYLVSALPFAFAGNPPRDIAKVAALGEHTGYVLQTVAGYSVDEVNRSWSRSPSAGPSPRNDIGNAAQRA